MIKKFPTGVRIISGQLSLLIITILWMNVTWKLNLLWNEWLEIVIFKNIHFSYFNVHSGIFRFSFPIYQSVIRSVQPKQPYHTVSYAFDWKINVCYLRKYLKQHEIGILTDVHISLDIITTHKFKTSKGLLVFLTRNDIIQQMRWT